MRILHLCLANFFYDNMNYQENLVSCQNARDGHEVLVIASRQNMDQSKLVVNSSGHYVNENGVDVERLNYSPWIPSKIAAKIRLFDNLYAKIDCFKPNIIVLHGVQTLSVFTVAKYLNNNSDVKLFIDNHAAYYNSAKGLLSKYILHRIIYKFCSKKITRYAESYLAIGYYEKEFLKENYNVPESHIRIVRLPARSKSIEVINDVNVNLRQKYGFEMSDKIYIHTGKMSKNKKSFDVVKSFYDMAESNSKLLIIGSIENDIKNEMKELIANDPRIMYLGWMNPNDLDEHLCMADFMLQPFAPTITIQQGIIDGCIPIIPRNNEYKDYVTDDRLLVSSLNELKNILLNTSKLDVETIHRMKEQSHKKGLELFSVENVANVYFSK